MVPKGTNGYSDRVLIRMSIQLPPVDSRVVAQRAGGSKDSVHRSGGSGGECFELIGGERTMVLGTHVILEGVYGREILLTRGADPLPAMLLQFVIEPLFPRFEQRVTAVILCANVGGKVRKYMLPALYLACDYGILTDNFWI